MSCSHPAIDKGRLRFVSPLPALPRSITTVLRCVRSDLNLTYKPDRQTSASLKRWMILSLPRDIFVLRVRPPRICRALSIHQHGFWQLGSRVARFSCPLWNGAVAWPCAGRNGPKRQRADYICRLWKLISKKDKPYQPWDRDPAEVFEAPYAGHAHGWCSMVFCGNS
jgi:hypothetical protein